MGHLLPQVPRRPAHAVVRTVMLHHMAPARPAALGTKQLLQPFIAQHQHRVRLNDQLRLLVRHSPSTQFLGMEEMQKIFPPVPLDALLRMGWAKQLRRDRGRVPPLRGGTVVFGWLETVQGSAGESWLQEWTIDTFLKRFLD